MIKVGILGTNIGKFHLEVYKKVEGYEVISIFGRNEKVLKDIGEAFQIKTTTRIEGILEDASIDIIDVCLPTSLHAYWIKEALKHHKDIFCETPLVYTLKELADIERVLKETGRKLFVNLFTKFSTPHKLALNLVQENKLGEIFSIVTYNQTAPHWGNMNLKNNIHNFHNNNIDFISELLGEPMSVYSTGVDLGEQSIVHTSLNYSKQKVVMRSYTNLPLHAPFRIGFEIHGEYGTIFFDAEYGKMNKEELAVYYKDKSEKEVISYIDDIELVETLKHISICLLEETQSSIIDLTATKKSLRIVDAINQSIDQMSVINL